ncbi:trypsin-like peptidase domain-containing protein [Saccharothrix deserti]|uniref:trypsin-like peptidase domain-containing protein n=1 Tax=Saccharothrix deserti TaxID=2593674 RepID=UPI00131D46BA|nr:trypsin-like peptidase domain-containing protein [Saccharothrix deserti]
MANFAIVIGIDRYDNPDFALSGAVSDALRFADWASAHGDVPPENLRLLLSSTTDIDREHGAADSAAIAAVVHEVLQGAAAQADRLFFHYAGHGLTAPGIVTGGPGEPMLVPSDVAVWTRDERLLVGFSQVITRLRMVRPATQFFFIDACRDFTLEGVYQPVIGPATSAWVPVGDAEQALSAQHILYATSPGQRAAEDERRRQGIFTPALVDGLLGAHRALAWSQELGQYEVRFSTLARHVKAAVRRRLAAVEGADEFVQEPQTPLTGAEDAVLARFAPDEVPKVQVRIQVDPRLARQACRLKVAYPLPGTEAVIWVDGPPVEQSSVVELPPFDYTFSAESPGYTEVRQSHGVYEPRVIALRLDSRSDPARSDVPEGGDGELVVTSPDSSAVIGIWNGERKQVASGSGMVYARLGPGLYRARLMLPEGGGGERLVEVVAGRIMSIVLDAPPPALTAAPMELLRRHEIRPDEHGYLEPAEQLGPMARPSLGSLLAFAALAANGAEQAERLRGLGVADVWDLPHGGSAVLAIVGSNRSEGLPADAELVVRDQWGSTLDRGLFDVLPRFPVAAQRHVVLPPGPAHVELRFPGHTPTRYAITRLPNRITVLVTVLEPHGRVEVQQYLLPAAGDNPKARLDLRRMHRIELAQRFYSTGQSVPRLDDLDDLLYGKWIDPLLGCLAGYMLIRQGETDRFSAIAVHNMLRHFPGLPDSYVLAALCEPEERDELFERALATGIPVFAEGFRALYEWVVASGRPVPPEMADIATDSVPGSPWTAWAADRPTFVVRDGTFEVPPFGWDDLTNAHDRIRRVIGGVGRVEPADGPSFSGTAFLVAPGVVATPTFVVDGFAAGRRFTVDFRAEPEGRPMRFAVLDVCRVVGTDPETVLLRLAERSDEDEALPDPVPVARRAVEPVSGRTVVVVGHPAFDSPAGAVKRVQPGRILGFDGQVIRHDATTAPGTAGAPLVDPHTGLVIGIHYAAQFGDRKEGRALPVWKLWPR